MAKAALPAFTPVPRRQQRHNGWTPQRQRDFVEALALTGTVEASAQRVGMTRESAYQLRRAPGAEEFAAAWAQALDFGVTRLEDLAIDRAINGVEVPVYSYGKLIGSRTVYNDRLLMFILRSRRPARYGNREKQPLSFAERAAAREALILDTAARIEADARHEAATRTRIDEEVARLIDQYRADNDRDTLVEKVRIALELVAERRKGARE